MIELNKIVLKNRQIEIIPIQIAPSKVTGLEKNFFEIGDNEIFRIAFGTIIKFQNSKIFVAESFEKAVKKLS